MALRRSAREERGVSRTTARRVLDAEGMTTTLKRESASPAYTQGSEKVVAGKGFEREAPEKRGRVTLTYGNERE